MHLIYAIKNQFKFLAKEKCDLCFLVYFWYFYHEYTLIIKHELFVFQVIWNKLNYKTLVFIFIINFKFLSFVNSSKDKNNADWNYLALIRTYTHLYEVYWYAYTDLCNVFHCLCCKLLCIWSLRYAFSCNVSINGKN